MKKKYTTLELIQAWNKGIRGKFINADELIIILLHDKGIVYNFDNLCIELNKTILQATWTKIQEPVSFIEAINSKKNIKSICFKSNFYCDIKTWLKIFSYMTSEEVLRLINDKWLIEENEKD